MTGNHPTDNDRLCLSKEQKQTMKKYAVFAAMGIISTGSIFYIFSPSAEDKAKAEAAQGFNTDIPMPKEESIIGDKRDAYEQETMQQKQEERMRSLQDFSTLLGGNVPVQSNDAVLITEEPETGTGSGSHYSSSIQSSAMAYKEVNRTLGNFYDKPREDPEKERLKQELEELKMRVNETDIQRSAIDNQLELMEKSFQMAAKYMPGVATTGTEETMGRATEPQGNTATSTRTNTSVSGKTAVAPIMQARRQTVSALLPEMSDTEFVETYSQARNMGFLTATGEAGAVMKNTLSTCIHSDQTVMDGQNVRLRLLEPMQAGNVVIPRNTLLSGTARIQGERLGITVNFLEYENTIIPVELRVYDADGQFGIFIPNLQELNAAKEIVANMGTSAGMSINLSTDAGKQLAADMGRNVIQGVSQFTAKKLREVKVHLKAGYKVYLLSEEHLKINNAVRG